MYYSYKLQDINGRNQIYDIYESDTNFKRCRIQRIDLEKVFVNSKVGLDKLGHGSVVQLSERELINAAMQLY
jgi:hypothetical protein